ncbi:eosinophil cationic protein-like [Peromyscus eremicus]|uniref:eosinophil cationic protein-like n=1 Tax=Peromyscus eremicus TaxID=42410 RepID=UPI0027DE333E|nr:eosinophil cationic protein-like [Peromyscus eremicus]
MGVKLLESRLRLLPLLLGLVMVVASFQIASNLTPSEKFVVRHINMSSPRCTIAMKAVNKLERHCKEKNSFLHTSFAAVVTVCGHSNVNCSDPKYSNCHNSPDPVSLTYCNLTTPRSHYTRCQYQTIRTRMFYRVACNRSTPQDSGSYPIVPVHLDGIF